MKNKQIQQQIKQAKSIANKTKNAILAIDDLSLEDYSPHNMESIQTGSGDFKEKIKKANKKDWY